MKRDDVGAMGPDGAFGHTLFYLFALRGIGEPKEVEVIRQPLGYPGWLDSRGFCVCAILLCVALLNACGSSADRRADQPPPLFDSLTKDDLRLADRTLQEALTVALSGTTYGWRNTANGNAGTVTPKDSFRTEEGVFCRSYVETVTIERKSELYENTACLDDSGLWKSLR